MFCWNGYIPYMRAESDSNSFRKIWFHFIVLLLRALVGHRVDTEASLKNLWNAFIFPQRQHKAFLKELEYILLRGLFKASGRIQMVHPWGKTVTDIRCCVSEMQNKDKCTLYGDGVSIFVPQRVWAIKFSACSWIIASAVSWIIGSNFMASNDLSNEWMLLLSNRLLNSNRNICEIF